MALSESSNVVDASRMIWDRMVDKACTMYEYHCDLERFVDEMEKLGFEREEVIDLVNGEYDD